MNARFAVASALLAAVLFAGSAARAQDVIELDHYTASETVADGFAVSRPEDLGHLQVDAQLHLDYAFNPLVYESDLGDADTETSSIVEHQLAAQFGVALGLLDRIVLFAGLPVTLVMEGDNVVTTLPTVGGAAMGDPRFGARARLVGDADSSFALALQLAGTAPLAHAVDEEQPYAGIDGFSFRPQRLVEIRQPSLRVTLDLGARLRKKVQLDTLTIGQEATFALGLAVPVMDDVTASLEVFGSTDFDLFEALSRTIVYQQLSGKAAATIYGRVEALLGKAPSKRAAVLQKLPDSALRGAGLSTQKTLAMRDLAAKHLAGALPSTKELAHLDDEAIVAKLTAVRGIGRWSAEMLMMFRLGRLDVMPSTDLGVQKGHALVYRKDGDVLPPKELHAFGERWRPYRSVAAWYLWRAVELDAQSRTGER